MTSRQRLALPAEWVFQVEGLSYPKEGAASSLEVNHTASQLFVQRAQRHFAGFELTQDNQPYIDQICQVTKGHPLALEIAASWIRLFTCQEILEKLQDDTSIDHQDPNLKRHKSLQIVFDQSLQGKR